RARDRHRAHLRAHARRVRRRADGGRQPAGRHAHRVDLHLRPRAVAGLRRGVPHVAVAPGRVVRGARQHLCHAAKRMDQAGSLTVAVEQRFASGFHLDASLDVALAPGSILVLFGPSAAGKTTVLRHIAGLERPDRGTVAFAGGIWCDVARNVWVPPQRRRVGLVFQQPTLFPHLTVRDNIHFGLASDEHPIEIRRSSEGHPTDIGGASGGNRLSHRSAADGDRFSIGLRSGRDQVASGLRSGRERVASGLRAGRERVAEIARVLGTADLENRYPRVLSGGEAQRVALARALAPGPQLVLLDEPFAALDAPTRLRLRRDVRALLQALGTPAVLVTHDRTEALAMGDAAAVMVAGRVRQVGAIADVFSRPGDADVAASLGVEAVLPARVRGTSGGLVEIEIDRVALHVAERDAVAPGSNVYACIRAEDVTLETRAPGQASARNHLAARVVGITPEGPIDRVALDCGFPLDALITRRSRDELQLAPGALVTAAIKATSIHLVPRA